MPLRARRARVVDLSRVRARLRLTAQHDQLLRLLHESAEHLERLFSSGAVLTRHGGHVARDVLRAREALLRAGALLRELSGEGAAPPPRLPARVEELYAEIGQLIERAGVAERRHAAFLDRLR